MPEHQKLHVLLLVAAEQQHSQAEQPAHQQAGDLEQHPASQSSPHHPSWRNGQAKDTTEFPGSTGSRMSAIARGLSSRDWPCYKRGDFGATED
jgi:hypothetical protein